MRHRLRILLALMSCCFLCITQSCSSSKSSDGDGGTSAKDDYEGLDDDDGYGEEPAVVSEPVGPGVAVDVGVAVPVAPVVAEVPLPVPLPPPPPPLPPPPTGAPPLIPWGGGGSREDDDHHREREEECKDDDHHKDKHKHKRKKCGNGEQEAFHRADRCKFDLYGTMVGPGGTSKLYGYFYKDKGEGTLIGEISGFHNVVALDFSPDGILYAINTSTPGTQNLLILDCKTAAATLVNPIVGIPTTPAGLSITDIDFDEKGSLFANANDGNGGTEQIGLIVYANKGGLPAGTFVPLPSITGTPAEVALGSIPFPINNVLYDASIAEDSINKLTGVGTVIGNLIFPATLTPGSSVAGMDADFVTNIMYVVIRNGTNSFLGTLDENTRQVSLIGPLVPNPPLGTLLVDIAVKQRYEECDFRAFEPPLPPGTICTRDCHISEIDCSDGIDNDQNGLTDCEDPECFKQPCNPHDGCIRNAVCGADFLCHGTDVVCPSESECLPGTCVSTGDFTHNCELTFGPPPLNNCTPDFNCSGPRNPDGTCPKSKIIDPCITGICELDGCPVPGAAPSVVCEPALKVTLPIAQGGCLNNRPCIEAICDSETGDCENEVSLGVICNTGNSCFFDGVCTAVTEPALDSGILDNQVICQAAFFGQCRTVSTAIPPGVATPAPECDTNNCFGAVAGTCFGSSGTACFDSTDCAGLPCIGATFGTCVNPAVTGLTVPCTLDSDCNGGHCVIPAGAATGQCAGYCNPLNEADVCPGGSACVGFQVGACSITGAACFATGDCPPVAGVAQTCTDPIFGVCTCSGTQCETATTCALGDCSSTTFAAAGTPCSPDDIACHTSSCGGVCSAVSTNAGAPCLATSECTGTAIGVACVGTGVCSPPTFNDAGCESCGSQCVCSTCTETGCEVTFLNGTIPCSTVIELAGVANNCVGTLPCVNGVEDLTQGTCMSGASPGSLCSVDADCGLSPCTAGLCNGVGPACTTSADCPGVCNPGCLANQPLVCTPSPIPGL